MVFNIESDTHNTHTLNEFQDKSNFKKPGLYMYRVPCKIQSACMNAVDHGLAISLNFFINVSLLPA